MFASIRAFASSSKLRFPETRKEVLDKWVTAMGRKNWKPTKYSRLCSIHFELNCFFPRKGTRLRLLPDAIPSIFDFRKIENNRKKAEEYSDMKETDCPDPELYELQTDPVVLKTAKSGQKCYICSGPANCDMKTDSVVVTKKGKVSLDLIIAGLADVKLNSHTSGYICLSCSQRLVNSYLLKCEIEESVHFAVPSSKEHGDEAKDEEKSDLPDEQSDNAAATATSSSFHKNLEQPLDENIIYCSYCDTNLFRDDVANHLLNCKMREEADQQNIPLHTRRLFVCCLCQFLVYRHHADDHIELCSLNKD